MGLIKGALGCLWSLFCIVAFVALLICLALYVYLSPPNSPPREEPKVATEVAKPVREYPAGDMTYILNNSNQKENVVLDLRSPMVYATEVAINVYKNVMGASYVPTITSGNDSQHMEGSKHYTNMAVDFRVKDVPPELYRQLYYELTEALPDYLILLETYIEGNEHIHIQYNH